MIDVFWFMVGVVAGTIGIIVVAVIVTGKDEDDGQKHKADTTDGR